MANRSDERTEFLRDIITTAVEGGTNYWAQVSQYQWNDCMEGGKLRVSVGQRVGDETRAVLHPLASDESGYEDEGKVIDIEGVARALGKIRSAAPLALNESIRAQIREADRDLEGGMVDAALADVIVQIALLGDVIYG